MRPALVIAMLGAHVAGAWALLHAAPAPPPAEPVALAVRWIEVPPTVPVAAPAPSMTPPPVPTPVPPARPRTTPRPAPAVHRPPPVLATTARAAPAPAAAPPQVDVPPAATVAPPSVPTDAAPDTPPARVAEPGAPAPATPAPPIASVPATAVRYRVAPAPDYPARSRRLGESGRVLVRVEVDAGGLPRHVELQRSSGFGRLDDAALAAVRAARFQPYTDNGVPLAVWTTVPIVFELEN